MLIRHDYLVARPQGFAKNALRTALARSGKSGHQATVLVMPHNASGIPKRQTRHKNFLLPQAGFVHQ
jgi:hypothetical protein